jgi:hypothetical protein
MGAQLGAHSARTCSWRLSPARLGNVLTWARTHSCRPPPSGNIPGVKGLPVQIWPSRMIVKIFEYNHASQEPTKELTCCAMALLETCAARMPRASCQGMCQGGRADETGQSSGQRSLTHPGSARRTHPSRTGRRHPRPHRLTASRSFTALQQLQDARQAWAPQPSLPTPWTRWPLA